MAETWITDGEKTSTNHNEYRQVKKEKDIKTFREKLNIGIWRCVKIKPIEIIIVPKVENSIN